jgi:methionyl-tRNA synthetase
MTTKKRVLVCSAWPYGSGVPHLGNIVSSLLSGDVFARYYRMRGHEVLYVSGTDAHGTTIEYEARLQGISPAQLAAEMHEKIRAVIDGFGIRFDNYTTTESPVHQRFVREIYLQMQENGYITIQEEARAYCRHCNVFLADRFITGTCPHCGAPGALGNQCDVCGTMLEPEQLVNPICSLCGKSEIEFQPTRHWYLDLGKLSAALSEYVASRGFQGNVHRFTQRMIDEGLRPRAMTRDIHWGIPAPFAGAEGKVIYVWGEAALGYVSATIEHFDGKEEWKRFWFGDDIRQIYTIGKDNIPFHTLIFPGQLIASGKGYHLPDQVAATEYLNWIGGQSFSKSRRVGLYGDAALAVMDGELWRFYLLYNRPEGRDVDFSWEELDKAVNGILISNVANLMNRVISFVQSRYERTVPDASLDPEVIEQVRACLRDVEAATSDGALGQALRRICALAVFGNEYFQRKAPWASDDKTAVGSAFHLVKAMAILLVPYVPEFAGEVLQVIGARPNWDDIETPWDGRTIGTDRILLERVDVEAIRARMEEPARETIPLDVFERLDLRVGTIRTAVPVSGSDRLYELEISLGSRTVHSVAGLREAYTADELGGRQVVVLANLEPTTLRGVRSEAMVLAVEGRRLVLLGPQRPVPPGSTVG